MVIDSTQSEIESYVYDSKSFGENKKQTLL